MGSTNGSSDEVPVHRVRLSQAFDLGKYEVTQAQWEAVMGASPSDFSACGGTCPVESVSWEDVRAFIGKLNAQEGVGAYRLPTEAEWEYAARAGTQTAYSFGPEASGLGAYGWYAGNSDSGPHPVGRKRPNGWGLYDMHGNVWEWGGGLVWGLFLGPGNRPPRLRYRRRPSLSRRGLEQRRPLLPRGESPPRCAWRPHKQPRLPPGENSLTLGHFSPVTLKDTGAVLIC